MVEDQKENLETEATPARNSKAPLERKGKKEQLDIKIGPETRPKTAPNRL